VTTEDYWFHLLLNPEPWRVGPVGVGRRSSGLYAYVGRDQQLDAFEKAVAESVAEQWGDRPPLEGNLRIEVFLWRQRAEYTTPNQRKHRKHEADATNMLKAIEDSLQGVVFENDRDNHDVRCVIMEQSAETNPQIILHITRIEHGWTNKLLSEMPVDIARKAMETIIGITTSVAEESSDNSWPPKG
jgi:Holliday junction resolvase RusA-like endonuclease